MRANLGRLASLACTLPLLIPCGVRAGYDLTLGMSDSDPHANVSMTPVGIDTLYLWLNCSEQGASALDATLEGDILAFGFSPASGIVNAGTFPRLLLGIGGCPTGSDVDALLGTITVWDSAGSGGHLYLGPSDGMGEIVLVSCDTTAYTYEFVPRVAGFSSNGSDPDTTGASFGCGVAPKMVPGEPAGSPAFEWSEDYDEPPSGKGANGNVTLIRALASSPNTLIVGGAFSAVDGLTVPNLARLTISRGSGALSTAWDIPTLWNSLSALSASKSYLAADQDASTGTLLVGGDDASQPLAVVTSSSAYADAPPVTNPYAMEVRAVEHWSENGKFLVAGDFRGTGTPGNGDLHGLAQYDPSAQFNERWQPFGYPITSEVWYVEQDGFSQGAVDAILEVKAPGRPLEGAVLVGGRFRYLFNPSDAFDVQNCAWLDPSDGSFEGLPVGAPVYTMVQTNDAMALDQGLIVYAAGDFGTEDGQGYEESPVIVSYVGGSAPGGWGPLVPGPYPHPGPTTESQVTSPVIHQLIATRDHLYAIGDFDQVLPARGEDLDFSRGFARYSFTTGRWEGMGEGLEGVGMAGTAAWPAVFVGGTFEQVGDGVESFHIAEADFPASTGVIETAAQRSRAALDLRSPRPNPMKHGAVIHFSLSADAHVLVAVYDAAGRVVRKLAYGAMTSGQHAVPWDGLETDGSRVSSGVYFVRASAGSDVATVKSIVVK